MMASLSRKTASFEGECFCLCHQNSSDTWIIFCGDDPLHVFSGYRCMQTSLVIVSYYLPVEREEVIFKKNREKAGEEVSVDCVFVSYHIGLPIVVMQNSEAPMLGT